MQKTTTEKLDPKLDPAVNKCVTCGLSRIYTDPKFDNLFVNIGQLYEAGKINYKINRIIIQPDGTIFCTLGLPQAMKINESCQFHQPKLDYPIEHYSTIYSATLSRLLTEETKNLTFKTKRLATIAIFIAIGIGLLQVCIGYIQVEISAPGWTRNALHTLLHGLLSLFSCP
jgi:hypothetical protein